MTLKSIGLIGTLALELFEVGLDTVAQTLQANKQRLLRQRYQERLAETKDETTKKIYEEILSDLAP